MILVDKDIRQLIKANALLNANERGIGSISYDLTTHHYIQNDANPKDTFLLAPRESVFVACEEIVEMPNDLVGKIILRNSRIRAGLMLDAPVYQPGHKTRIFFRITNVSEKSMNLDKSSRFASIMFERLNCVPETGYNGEFQNELDYKSLGAYKKKYKAELQDYEDKENSLHNMEKSIYGNVMALMSVFIALFSLININIELAYADSVAVSRMLVFNLTTVGSIAFLVALLRLHYSSRHKRESWFLFAAALAMFVAALLIAI